MSKNNRELLEKKLKSIEKGAYYFGIIGRISIAIGVLCIFISLLPIFLSLLNPTLVTKLLDVQTQVKLSGALVESLSYVIYGFLFIVARDAFDAIKAIISELEEIV